MEYDGEGVGSNTRREGDGEGMREQHREGEGEGEGVREQHIEGVR